MKRLFSILCLMAVVCSALAKTVVIDGVKYDLKGQNINVYAVVKGADKASLPVNLVIPAHIVVGGKEYPVTRIDDGAFKDCRRLESVVTPNSITHYGKFAFLNCSSLRSAVMSDNASTEIYQGDYGFGKGGIFKGCTSLRDVRGNSVPYPRYVIYDTFIKADGVPFYNTIEQAGALAMTQMEGSVPFSRFAEGRVKSPVENWQKRKDYETVAQWESRVSDANRASMIREYTLEARNSYLKENAPSNLVGTLEDYNADYGFFPVSTLNLGTLYVQVSPADRDFVASNWRNARLQPVYGILDDQVGVLDCKFVVNGREFPSARSYEEDDLSTVALGITPLSALREYEQMMAAGSAKGAAVKSGNAEPDIVDVEIPAGSSQAPRTFAVVIGNEDYQRVAPVEFAMNDARVFSKYCTRTLGIPESNVRTYYNATFGDIVAAMEDIENISKAYDGDINVIFYYAGHGVPDESTRNAYILPVDATGGQTDVCYPLSRLYQQLGDLNANSVVAFIDACFSGSLRGDGMLASARGIKLKPRDIPATGNLVVVSAASADQSALPYGDKNHGLFTYHLLRKLHDSKGDVTIGELTDYITTEVNRQSVVEAKKPQTPTVKVSSEISDSWRNISLK